MKKDRVNVAIVGLGFGTQFIPIYKRHPQTNMYAICRRSRAALDAVGEAFGVAVRYDRFEDVLSDPLVDFVHINSPLADHGWMSIAALKAGKHAMCTVPMALTVDECGEIVRLIRETGLKYMMAETVLYSREFFLRESSTSRASSVEYSSCRAAITRIWTAGPTIGRDCRRCSMRRIAFPLAWRSFLARPNTSLALARVA
jgi:hypothetical protein